MVDSISSSVRLVSKQEKGWRSRSRRGFLSRIVLEKVSLREKQLSGKDKLTEIESVDYRGYRSSYEASLIYTNSIRLSQEISLETLFEKSETLQ